MDEKDFDICRANPGKPCLYDVAERHEGVVVEVLRCRRCGRRSIQWMRPEIAALQDAMIGDADAPHPSPAATPSPREEGLTEAKTAADTPEPRDYWEMVEELLRDLQERKVRSLIAVALIDDENIHDVLSVWGAGPYELSDAAGILQLHAGLLFNQINGSEDEEDEEDDEDDV